MTPIVIPADFLGAGDEGVISTWLAEDGDIVAAGATVAELMLEKTSFSLEAPCAGRLRILVSAEAPVKSGQVVGMIEP